MMNIGHRPTIGNKAKSIEVNLFNFNRDIYDKIISIDVVVKIRDEKKFSSINALKKGNLNNLKISNIFIILKYV